MSNASINKSITMQDKSKVLESLKAYREDLSYRSDDVDSFNYPSSGTAHCKTLKEVKAVIADLDALIENLEVKLVVKKFSFFPVLWSRA